MSAPLRQPAVLLILDGFGVAPPSRGNAIALAKTPTLDHLTQTYPTMTLQASGEAVGLPWGDMGNSEVGHLSLGSGRILFQDLPRITRSIVDGSFFTNPVFHQATERIIKGGKLHVIGMFSTAGVHSFDEHAFALLELCQRQKAEQVFVHVILDGRDSPYNSGLELVEKLTKKMSVLGVGKIATISGRSFAMDRDNHWDRIALAYDAMTSGSGPTASDPHQAIESSYQAGVYDEQFIPTVITENGQPVAMVENNDAVIFFNFRSDRARQLTKAFVLPGLDKFSRPKYLQDLFFVTMTEYEANLPVSVAFPPEQVTEPLAKVYADAGLKQLHSAETEKYAHVTFFLNGGQEAPFSGEDRIVVPSPSVPSYDQKPEMSARDITERVTKALRTTPYSFVVINFANPDMIGHTGNIPATIEAVEVVDECIGQLFDVIKQLGGFLMITADHGNAEEKINGQTGEVSKEHSANPVPLIIAGENLPAGLERYRAPLRDLSALTPVGVLADVAPTLLALAGLDIPSSMTGRNLLRRL